MTVLLSVQGLTKGFGPRPLFTDLSLDLRAGERVGLIGPNGSGKSTLLKLLAGREEPDAGTRVLRRGARVRLRLPGRCLRPRPDRPRSGAQRPRRRSRSRTTSAKPASPSR